MPTTNQPITRTSVAVALVLASACAARPTLEPTVVSEAGRVAVAALGQQLAVDPATLEVAAVGTARYPNLNRIVQSFKVVDRKGRIHGIALDPELRPVDLQSFTAEERAQRQNKFGALDPSLAQRIEQLGEESIAVVISVRDTTPRRWDRVPARGEKLESSVIDRLYADVTEARAAAVRDVIAPALERVRQFDSRARAEELSPMISATLTADALRALAYDSDIDTIYLELPAQAELDIAKAATGITTVHASGTRGGGVRVADIQGLAGLVEANSLLLRPVLQDGLHVCPMVDKHATAVAGVMIERRVNLFGTPAGEEGAAPNIELRAGGSCSTHSFELQEVSTRGVRWGARIINLTWGLDTNLALGGMDRFYDDIVLNLWRTVVKSAGNRGTAPGCFPTTTTSTTTSPGLAYNVITVGGFDDRNTVTWNDDTVYPCSSAGNPISLHSDREKPEIAAPAVDIILVSPGPANLQPFTGTSAAAPLTTSVSALLIERNNRLSVWPEIIRAVLMATAAHNIEGATRLSDVDGAGGLDASTAASLIDTPGRWDGVFFGCNGTDPLDLATLSVSRRTRNRVVLSWDSDPTFADYATRPSADIDLRVVDANGRTVASSLSFDNTNEIVEFDSWQAGTFSLQAVRFRCDLPTWLGWAWHTLPIPRLSRSLP